MIAMHYEELPFPNEKDFVSAQSILEKVIQVRVLDESRKQSSVFIDEFPFLHLAAENAN
jgi:hypothetical protein